MDGRRPYRRHRRAGRCHPPRPRQDTRIEKRAAVTSRLETLSKEQVDERAWNFVAVGAGHPDGVAFWERFIEALRAAGYDGPLSIENEDYSLGQRESVSLAVRTLQSAWR